MQKKLLITSFFLSLFFSSCSIYENIYFLEDGSDALFTQDGKTVIIEYPAQIIAEPTQDLDVEIVTE